MTNHNRRSIFHHARLLPTLALAVLAALLLGLPGTQPQPAQAQGVGVWSATLTVKRAGANDYGCSGVLSSGSQSCGNPSVLSSNKFTYGPDNYTINYLAVTTTGHLDITFTTALSDAAKKLTLYVGSESFDFENADRELINGKGWDSSGLSWSSNDKISLRLTGPNAPATGTPAVSGPVTVGQTLTADKANVADQGGLPDDDADLKWQWVRQDDATGTGAADITDETHSTYALTSADVGKYIAVKLSFTDKGGNSEGPLKSTALGPVVAAPAATSVPYNWALIPRGLGPGDSFRLLFVTSNKRDGTSSAASDYDSHVQARAAAGHTDIRSHSTKFKALVSTDDGTSTVNARDHTLSTFGFSEKGVPVYWLGWRMAAQNHEDLHDGMWMEERGVNEDGADLGHLPLEVWTGSNDDGTASGNGLGTANPTYGELNRQWDGDENPLSGDTGANSGTRPLYALSGVFTVAEPAPSDGELFAWVEGMQLQTHLRWRRSSDSGVTGYQVQRALQYRPDNGGAAVRSGPLVYEVVAGDAGNVTSYVVVGQHERNFRYRALPIKDGVVEEDQAIYASASTTVTKPELHMAWNPTTADADIRQVVVQRRLKGWDSWESDNFLSLVTSHEETQDYLRRPGYAVEIQVPIQHTDYSVAETLGPITLNVPPIVGQRHYCVLNNGVSIGASARRLPLFQPKTWFQLQTDVTEPVKTSDNPFTVTVLAASQQPLNPDHACYPVVLSPLNPPTFEMVYQEGMEVNGINWFDTVPGTLEHAGIERAHFEELGDDQLPSNATVIGRWDLNARFDPSLKENPWYWKHGVLGSFQVYTELYTDGTRQWGVDGHTLKLSFEAARPGAPGELLIPENLAATAHSDRVELTWDEVEGAAGYKVQRRGETGDFAEIATPTANSHTDTGVTVGKNYHYKVQATNESGDSELSDPVLAVVLPPPPLAPTNLTATATVSSVTLIWDAPDDDTITGYVVFRKVRDADPPEEFAGVDIVEDAATTEVTDNGVADGAAYTYRVVSMNMAGQSEPAEVDVDTPPSDADSVRSGAVSLGAQNPDRGRRFFRDKSLDRANGDEVDYYSFTTDGRYELGLGVRDQTIDLDVWLEDSDGNTIVQSSPPPVDATVEWLKTAIDPGTYYIRVQAMADGQTGYYIRLGLNTTAPAPTGLSPGTANRTGVALSWSGVSDATRYRVEYRKAAATDWSVHSDTVTGTAHTVSGLECGTDYRFRVRAYGDGDPHPEVWGAASGEASKSTLACNAAPVFGSASYSFTVAKNAAVGAAVGSVSATDADADTLTYRITAWNATDEFALASGTGAITVAGTLKNDTTWTYMVLVQADDGNGGTATVTVRISVTDADENAAPAFGSASYSFSVAEDAATGDAVGTVSATDADDDSITYSITAGNGDGKFAIGSSRGAIIVEGSLDHEATSSYALTVQADDGNGGTNTAAVNITVTDVNEAPEFGEIYYHFQLAEDTAVGAAVRHDFRHRPRGRHPDLHADRGQ